MIEALLAANGPTTGEILGVGGGGIGTGYLIAMVIQSANKRRNGGHRNGRRSILTETEHDALISSAASTSSMAKELRLLNEFLRSTSNR